MKKKREMHDNIVLLGKVKLDAIEFLLSKALIDSFISHNELFHCFRKKHYPNWYEEFVLIPNLKFQMKLKVTERLEKY